MVKILPKTRLGKWSCWLIIVFIVLLAVFFGFVESGERGGETYFSNLKLAVPFTAAWLCGIASFFTGAIAVIWKRERAVLVFVSALIGLFVLWFISAELMFPH